MIKLPDGDDQKPLGTGLTLGFDSFIDDLHDDRVLGFVDASAFQSACEKIIKSFEVFQFARDAQVSSATYRVIRPRPPDLQELDRPL